MARRPDKRETEMLSEDNLKEIRHNLAHLSLPAVRDFYEQAYGDCRLVYNNLPSPRQIQTLVQVWKQVFVEVAMSSLTIGRSNVPHDQRRRERPGRVWRRVYSRDSTNRRLR
jgi:hypothetical protein